ncbi:MAG: Pyridoxine 5'-phosphate synthase [Gemmatimonadaceae bacterium]|nr:Pyridoxine 5'-phosphate synthase [Gemmatimonadaceae bacterium]
MRAPSQRLYVNIDHVATIRQARRTVEPDPVLAAVVCERAGADGITAHLREDRRHIQDADVERLATAVETVLNLEMACTDEMLAIALRLRPHQVTLVPERREEITTEGGLDVSRNGDALRTAIDTLHASRIRVSLFIDPVMDAVQRAHDLGAAAIELHTGPYSDHPDDAAPLLALRNSAAQGARLGLAVHAGHGLTVRNVGLVAAIDEIEELNIGHSIVSRSVFVGIEAAVREMRAAIGVGRRAGTGSAVSDNFSPPRPTSPA